ncbi:MAG: DUF58 domain-containing protein [Candidatus Nanopelagicales bacterium]
MTWRWRLLVAGSLATGAIGWALRWPELVGLAAAGIVVGVAVPAWWGGSVRGSMVVEPAPEFVPRLSKATVPVVIDWEGPPRQAWASCASTAPGEARVWVPTSPGATRLPWPIDSRHRGSFRVGPTDLLYADPFGLVGRLVGRAQPSPTTVTPRQVPVPPVRARSSQAEELEGVRVGHENFHTLREYVFGDEPRKIHWRSSARAQKLLVRVSVDAAEEQTVIVLDVDAEAYRPPGALPGVVDRAMFEDAVDLAHSLALDASGPGRVAHVTTNRPGARAVTVDAHHRHTGAFLLAHAEPLPGHGTAGQDVAVVLKRAAVREVVVVTGRVQPPLVAAITGWRRHVQDVRVASVVPADPA